jgi:hypothetical protein
MVQNLNLTDAVLDYMESIHIAQAKSSPGPMLDTYKKIHSYTEYLR